jgi:hypothetical protein
VVQKAGGDNKGVVHRYMNHRDVKKKQKKTKKKT